MQKDRFQVHNNVQDRFQEPIRRAMGFVAIDIHTI